MPEADPAAFRRRATRLYRASLVALAILSATWLGLAWLAGGRFGLLAGLVTALAGLALAAAAAFAATLIWTMSQDGGRTAGGNRPGTPVTR